jgi:hypothetical protein
MVRAKDAWERALECAGRAQQVDDQRTCTATTQVRNSWIRVANNPVFAGSAVNIQFMVKDSKKYPASGGRGYADLTNGKPGDQALQENAFPATCLQKITTTFSLATHRRPEKKHRACFLAGINFLDAATMAAVAAAKE